ncbi:galactose mutarotase-like protein [Wilcoxina mikolae CBS 423.85]|nr:galactose mutarotase-like protein [Wilcoxina mikolae CBS 423.85]
MVDRPNKPDALAVSRDIGHASGVTLESDRVKLSLPSGESATILFYGATVISWIAGGEERLFLSDKAKLDGTKAVRGGVPLVFPVFGKTTEGPTASLPQHGFARITKWEVLGKIDESQTSVQVDFGLGPENLDVDSRKQWPFDFGLIYSVVLSKTSLETKLLVRNEGSQTFDFNALFHTYLRVPDVTTVAVEGLKGITYKDKVQKGAQATEERDLLTVDCEVDRVYAGVPGTVTVTDGEKPLFKVERSKLDDVVIWNPWEGSSGMADFGPADGYKNMLCVEAGAVSSWQTLEPQSVWEGGVTISL